MNVAQCGYRALCAMALLPIGTGNDFARSVHYGAATDVERILHIVSEGVTVDIDIGHIAATFPDTATASSSPSSSQQQQQGDRDREGPSRPGYVTRGRFFLNEVSFGISAEVMRAVNSSSGSSSSGNSVNTVLRRLLGRSLTFAFHALWKQATYRNRRIASRNTRHRSGGSASSSSSSQSPQSPVLTEQQGEDEDEEDVGVQQLTVCCNGQYFGSGMRPGVGASLTDGMFTTVVLGDVGPLEAARLVRRVYSGTHIGHRKVRTTHNTARYEAWLDEGEGQQDEDQQPEPVRVEADGELFGQLPAVVTNVHRLLPFVVPHQWAHSL